MIVSAPLALAEPAAVALDFLGKVRDGRANLEPGGDTALSVQTQPAKRAEIARRLERAGQDLKNGGLEVVESRVDGELGGVIVRKSAGYDPSLLRVLAVALVKRGERWLPAPVPGSFENCGLGFDQAIRTRARELENWMLSRQAQLLEASRQDLARRMQEEIASSINPAQLRAMSAAEVGRRFVDACAAAQPATVLALLGGLQPELPADWSARLQAATKATAAPQTAARPWRLLVAPEVIRVIVHEEALETEGSFSVACIDPMRSVGTDNPPVEFVHLALEQSDAGLWQVNLPRPFLTSRPDADEEMDGEIDGPASDRELLGNFPARLREKVPAAVHPELSGALAALHEALLAPTPLPLVSLLDLDGPVTTARRGCAAAAALWGALHDSRHIRTPLLLEHMEDGATAAASYQFFSVRQDRLNLRLFFFEKGKDGWRLVRGLLPEDEMLPRFEKATAWAKEQGGRWADGWRARLLGESRIVMPSAARAAPDADAVAKLLDDWFAQLAKGDPAALIRLTARLDTKSSQARLLRNLGYEINTARRTKSRPATLAVVRGEAWAAAAVRATADNKPSITVYPIVGTPSGPRILLETDLFVSNDRARDYLNNQSFSALGETLPASTVEELRGLFKKLAADPAVTTP